MLNESFFEGEHVVYPPHGVGIIESIKLQRVAGYELELFVIIFDRDHMTLLVPVLKARKFGLRKLSSQIIMNTALETLKNQIKSKKTIWSRRVQEYEAKINSGNPILIAEVIRDLHRNTNQPDQSYSERQIYETATDRLASELAVIECIKTEMAEQKLKNLLNAS
ncbi:MAG: CarD family transcriptional regulator [Rhodospirillaceae bacterium]|jgi:CarD family transcriptional regulator|nr:CarD family transcriptional regulator [Rhodospirillaceae bacterium]